jgi:hypothetical protein
VRRDAACYQAVEKACPNGQLERAYFCGLFFIPVFEGDPLMTPKRSGLPRQYTLEPEAVEILQTLAPNRKSQGALLSTLLRQEEQRRADLRQLRAIYKGSGMANID